MSLINEIQDLAKGWRWGRRPLVPRSAEPFRGELPSDEFPTDWARTPLVKAIRKVFHRFVLRPVVFNEVDIKLEGLDNLDDITGPVIFYANHTSHLDGSLIMACLPTQWRENVSFAAAKDYFFDKWWKSLATGFVYNAFPVDRSRGRGTISTAERLIDEGWSIVVFPEGTRSRDGWINRFRHGAARMCLEKDIPAVPIAIRGANAAMPTGKSWPKGGHMPVNVRFGLAVVPIEGEDHKAFSVRMTQAVSQLLDEDRTTWFEAAQRAAQGETPIPRGPDGPRWMRVWEGTRTLPPRRSGKAWPRG